MDDDTRPTKRRSREELRDLVLGAALDLIRAEGLGVEPTTVTYQRVFDHLEEREGVRVTRASVHERIWDSQEHFQHDVLLRASLSESGIPATTDVAIETYERTVGLDSVARMMEMTRSAAPANLALLRSIGSAIGMRPRRDLFPAGVDGFEVIAQLGIALSEGISVRTRFDKGELPDVELRTGPDGELQSWTAFAAGYWALLNTFLEVDPDAHRDSTSAP